MRIMLDNSIQKIYEARTAHDLDFLQLRTPLTRYRACTFNHIQYGLDNGAFTDFNEVAWRTMVGEGLADELCLWIAMPDIVGDWDTTLEQFWHYQESTKTPPEKSAIVLQDNLILDQIPWDDITCIFLGGTDLFKKSHLAFEAVLQAKAKKKWVHVGRVNTRKNVARWFDFADTIDGSGIARFDHQLLEAVETIKSLQGTRATSLSDWSSQG